MIPLKKLTLSLILFSSIVTVSAQSDAPFKVGMKAPNVHHTGEIWLNHLSDADENFDYNVVLATSMKGSKLNWHKHPKGQQLLIISGVGYYQERGEAVQVIRAGDVIKCNPGVEHWHAATPESEVTYIAISGNQSTEWLDKITNDYYLGISKTQESLSEEEELTKLSKQKWQWMADKNVEQLEKLFHEKSKFVHMGGTWGKEREINIINSGNIHYKKADVHDVSVDVVGDTAVLYNHITLLAVVGENEVTNPFMVTEVYKKLEGKWKLLTLAFSRLISPN